MTETTAAGRGSSICLTGASSPSAKGGPLLRETVQPQKCTVINYTSFLCCSITKLKSLFLTAAHLCYVFACLPYFFFLFTL